VFIKALNPCHILLYRELFYSEDTKSRILEMLVSVCQTAQCHIPEDRKFGNAARTSNLIIYSNVNIHTKRHPLSLVLFFLSISLA
jgi:hypothetical protein